MSTESGPSAPDVSEAFRRRRWVAPVVVFAGSIVILTAQVALRHHAALRVVVLVGIVALMLVVMPRPRCPHCGRALGRSELRRWLDGCAHCGTQLATQRDRDLSAQIARCPNLLGGPTRVLCLLSAGALGVIAMVGRSTLDGVVLWIIAALVAIAATGLPKRFFARAPHKP